MTERGFERQLTLADLAPGQGATVAGFAHHDPIVQRIMQLGLLAGTTLTVVRTAPTGDPIEVDLLGYSLSLRRSEAALVFITDVC